MEPRSHYAAITRAGGAKFWLLALRNLFITVAERELMLPRSLTKRLVNHARPQDVAEGYAANWTVEQMRVPAQRIADRIDTLAPALRRSPHRTASEKQVRDGRGPAPVTLRCAGMPNKSMAYQTGIPSLAQLRQFPQSLFHEAGRRCSGGTSCHESSVSPITQDTFP